MEQPQIVSGKRNAPTHRLSLNISTPGNEYPVLPLSHSERNLALRTGDRLMGRAPDNKAFIPSEPE